ncbi:type II secretion system F family protein [Alteribacter aurantiacus]|uniref:type II secretion system F family protein n=1 Tax=Alteribacter aurantiacus TaxID=254410 RepID=UPI0004117373|nr:type II secretion system F family protein [Alteribacter aurantiacus]
MLRVNNKLDPFANELEKGEWLKELSTLIDGGYPIKEALVILEKYYDGKVKVMIQSITGSLRQGEYLSDTLVEYGFSREITSHLLMMEKYGDFSKGLTMAAELCKTKHNLREHMKRLLQYPMMMLFALIVLVSVVLRSVLPQFESFFTQMDQDLPLMTTILFRVLQMIDIPSLLILGACFAIGLWFFKKWTIQKRLDFLLTIPILSYYVRALLTFFLVSQIYPLLNSGMSLHQCLLMIKQDSQLTFYQNEAERMRFIIQGGERFSTAVNTSGVYEKQLVTVIALGEAKGRIGEELERYSHFLFSRICFKFEKSIKRLQPMLYLVIGLFVLLLFLSLMLPVFQMTSTW